MAHNVETMAYAGETPWHGLGKNVHPDLTPAQFLTEAGLDWTVGKYQNLTAEIIDGQRTGRLIANGSYSLVRESDGSILCPHVGEGWEPIQNHEMAGFFHDFVMKNEIKIETGGSLQSGKIVWFLGKTNRSFELKFDKKRDLMDNFLLFSLYHKFGFASDIRNTDIRVVCNNTFSAAHSKEAQVSVKWNHRKPFDVEEAKTALKKSAKAQEDYQEKAQFIASKFIRHIDVMDYFQDLFPGNTTQKNSRNALICKGAMDIQPGAELGEGTWWQAFNAVTYATDHLIGKDTSKRLTSAWYGDNREVKTKALNLALEYARL